jgi:hypothetical protein
MRAAAFVIVAASAALVDGVFGCGPACAPQTRSFEGGRLERRGDAIFYESSPPSGPFLPFDGGTYLHVKHGFGTRPHTVQIYLSFSEYPESAGGGGAAPSAGNQTVIQSWTDREIQIRNDSCANYWIRVVATGWGASADPPADGGALADGGETG